MSIRTKFALVATVTLLIVWPLALKANANLSWGDGKTPLHIAAASANVGEVKRLLRAGANVNAPANNGSTSLHLAVETGDRKTTQILLDAGANLNVLDGEGLNALRLASRAKDADMVKLILRASEPNRVRGKRGSTALMLALQRVRRVRVEDPTDDEAKAEAERLKQERADMIATASVLLDAGADASAQENYHTTALSYAIRSGLEDIAIVLLDRGAQFTEREMHGRRSDFTYANMRGMKRTVARMMELSNEDDPSGPFAVEGFKEAVRAGHTELAAYFLERGLELNSSDLSPDALLTIATRGGHTELVQLLIERGAEVNGVGPRKQTSLMVAAAAGDLDMVRMLLEAGAKPTGAALSSAVGRGLDTNVVELLVEAGALRDMQRGRHTKIVLGAMHHGTPELLQYLLDAGVDPSPKPGDSYGPYEQAGGGRNLDVLKILFAHPARPDSDSAEARTVLARASSKGHIENMRFLLDLGVDPSGPTVYWGTPLSWTTLNQHVEAMEFLVEAGADVNAVGQYGRTPLISSVRNKSYSQRPDWTGARLLLNAGADPRIKDKSGKTALDYAVEKNYDDLAKLLRAAMEQE